MELIDPPGSVYTLQVHGLAPDLSTLAAQLGLVIPEPEGSSGDPDRGDYIWRGEGDDCVLTITRGGAPIPKDVLLMVSTMDTYVDTATAEYPWQPQYRGDAGGLLPSVANHSRY
jgi:hypothetical protein